MEKSLKKCYKYLDLPLSSTVEDVVARKNAMIKILQAKANETKITTEKEIALVENSANAICKNIEQNGIPKDEMFWFQTSKESIFGLVVVLMFICLMCFFSFYAFL